MNVEQRFNKYVRRTRKCWHWTGTPKNRYGKFYVDGRREYAHRVAYQLWVGDLPDYAVVHHTCGNSKCVRPSHLQAITQANNVAEMLERHAYIKAIYRLETELRRLRKQLKEKR